jgi:twinkle protein
LQLQLEGTENRIAVVRRDYIDAERTIHNIDSVKGKATVILVEGEMDVLACIEAGYAAVITLPDGAPSKVKDEPDPADKRYADLAVWEVELEHVEKFILATDADGPGRAHAEEIARRLGKEKCWRVEWPTINDAPRKDANEVLIGDGSEVLRECIEAAEPYPISGLYNAEDFQQEVLDLYLDGHSKASQPSGMRSRNT